MRRQVRSSSFSIVVVLMLSAFPAWLCAQQAPAPDQEGPPERDVARLSVMNGQVTVRRGDAGEWVAGIVNAPLMAGDRIATGQNSRTEVQFDSANLLRIGANAEARLAQLDTNRYNLQVAHGTVTFRMLRESPVQVELDTPTVSVRPTQPGAYRIYVQQDGQTEITVRLGQAQIFTPKGSQDLQAGQTMLARGSAADPEFQIVPAIAMDEWDQWNEMRDGQLMNSTSNRYVPQDESGAEDLDQNGSWIDEPDYGYVWSPNVGPDWAPYQNGQWSWGGDDYGWTWIDYDPWGWAPFHYGSWFFAPRHGWCWYPGGFGANYWAPARVAFFGYGAGIGVGFGFGNVGWVALAPFEHLNPWWGRGFAGGYGHAGAFGRANIVNGNVAGMYRNARVPNAVMSVSAGDFAQGRFNHIAHVNGAQLRQAGMVRGALPVAPTAASLRFSNNAVPNVAHSPGNMRFFGRGAGQTASSQRAPFAAQQRAMQQYSRQTPNYSSMASARPNTAGGSAAASGTPRAASGWRPMSAPAAAQSNRAAGASSGGWQRFGEPRPAATGWGSGGWNSSGWNAQSNAWRPSGASSYGAYRAPSAYGYRPQAIRIAPPLVRERSAAPGYAPRSSGGSSQPRSNSGGGRSSGGGFHGGGGGGSHGGGGHR